MLFPIKYGANMAVLFQVRRAKCFQNEATQQRHICVGYTTYICFDAIA